MRVEVSQTSTQTEKTQFAATVHAVSADGRVIDASAALSMERVETHRADIVLRAGDANKVDPLVLNLSGGAARFEGTHEFDLNADGTKERLARLSGASAYLALDRNHDGRIDDGSELFGPTTGSGYGELSALDGDGNGWVDEADAAFADLRLMYSSGAVTSLAAAQVGALSTGWAATPFEVKDTAGTAQASVAQTGVFLREDGSIGTMQHVDLIV